MTPLHLACTCDSVETLYYLAETASMGATDPVANVVDKDGNTPLHTASECGATRCMEYLLENWSMMSLARNRRDQTPLGHCCQFWQHGIKEDSALAFKHAQIKQRCGRQRDPSQRHDAA